MDRETLIEEIGDVIMHFRLSDEDSHHIAKRILSRLTSLGLVVVEKEPTDEMIEAGARQLGSMAKPAPGERKWDATAAYRAMIDAASGREGRATRGGTERE